jgi:hypothetical protein
MNYRQVSFSLCLSILFAVAVSAKANDQQPAAKPVAFRIVSVLAANTNEGVDARLQPLGRQLQSLFPYSTYRLLSRQHQRIRCGRAITFTLPGGRILNLEPRGIEGNMIAMHLMLFQGAQPVMTTDVKLANHGILMVGGPRYHDGWLIISIGADAFTNSPPSAIARQRAAPIEPAEATQNPAPVAPSAGPKPVAH